MGIIKFEVDIPEFQDELTISLTIKRDGKVVETISPTTPPKAIEPLEIKSGGEKPIKKTKKSVTSSGISGNLMDLDADF